MAQSPTITFVPLAQKPAGPVLGLFASAAGIPAEVATLIGEAPSKRLASAMKAEEFKGKGGASLSLPAEPGFGNESTHVMLIGLDGDDEARPPMPCASVARPSRSCRKAAMRASC